RAGGVAPRGGKGARPGLAPEELGRGPRDRPGGPARFHEPGGSAHWNSDDPVPHRSSKTSSTSERRVRGASSRSRSGSAGGSGGARAQRARRGGGRRALAERLGEGIGGAEIADRDHDPGLEERRDVEENAGPLGIE